MSNQKLFDSLFATVQIYKQLTQFYSDYSLLLKLYSFDKYIDIAFENFPSIFEVDPNESYVTLLNHNLLTNIDFKK